MYREIEIGEKKVPMMSMASVDLYYKHIFGEDPIKVQMEASEGDMVNFIIKMGFVMSKYAEIKVRKEMLKLNEDSFMDWMDQFERDDLYDMDKLSEIQDVYEGNRRTTSESKNVEDQ